MYVDNKINARIRNHAAQFSTKSLKKLENHVKITIVTVNNTEYKTSARE